MKLFGRRHLITSVLAAVIALGAASTTALAVVSPDWPTYHKDNYRAGTDVSAPLATGLAPAWSSVALDGAIYAEPLVVGNLVIVATENDSIYALNAATGAQVWMAHVATPVTLTNPPFPCGNISPLGITGTPVVDVAAGVVYAVAFESGANYYLVGRNLSDGTQKFAQVLIAPGTGFDTHFQQQRAALTLANGYVYAPFGGYAGDCGSYHGWMIGVPASGSGTQVTFNDQAAFTGANEAAYWATSGPSVDASGNLFMTSGNAGGGTGFNGGETITKLSPTLSQLDYWAPTVWATLNGTDNDLGSVGPLLVGPTHNLVFQTGKSGWGYLLNAGSLSSGGHITNGLFGAKVCNAATTDTAAGDQVFGALAYVDPYIYVPCPEGIKALLLNSSAPSFSVAWTSSPAFHAGPPIVAGGVVWALDTNGGRLYGLNPSSGVAIVNQAFGSVTSRFTTPAASGGRLFATSGNVVKAMTLVGGPTYYFPWYDFATPGFQSDYFAVANPGPNWANVQIQLPGAAPLSFGVPHGTSKYVSFPRGTIGGPVTVTTDGEPVLVTQRTVFDQTFSERAAVAAASLGTSLTFPWYDWATPEFGSDYFYVANPGATAANVSISLPGATTLNFMVGAGSATFKTFPHGTVGGPVKLTSDQPVTASQRVLFLNSFTEIPASLPASASTSLVFPWYDWASPDFGSDYFYIAVPGATMANVTINLPGATALHVAVAAGTATFKTFPHGTVGGPVTITSDQPVLVSQRSLFDGNFSEVAASLAASETTSVHFAWYDWANPDLQSDYFYVANPGPNWANILVSIPGYPVLSFGVPHGTTKAMTFPRGTIGGPVTVTTDGEPVLVSQRVVFDTAFEEFTPPAGW
jgi:outer membrane protein assembly factor BamB